MKISFNKMVEVLRYNQGVDDGMGGESAGEWVSEGKVYASLTPETLSHDKEAGTIIEYTRIKVITRKAHFHGRDRLRHAGRDFVRVEGPIAVKDTIGQQYIFEAKNV